jgi:glycosyltransferase involved in cell wall biosynthesis
VEDGKTGFLVEPGDWIAAAGRLKLLLTDGELRKRMALEALDRASGFPSWEETTGRTVRAIRERLAKHKL